MTKEEADTLRALAHSAKWSLKRELLTYLDTATEEKKGTRTSNQNRALHKWFTLKADQCREAGVTAQLAFSKTMELDMTPDMMKAIWKSVQQPLLGKSSTTELSKIGEIEKVLDHLNRFFAEHFHLEGIELPHEEPLRAVQFEQMDRAQEPEDDFEEPLL